MPIIAFNYLNLPDMKLLSKSLNASGKPIESIEMLRGIASFWVLLFHLTNNPAFLPRGSAMQMLGRWGWTGVEIFFIISGFVIPYAMYAKGYVLRDFPIFFKKRIIRIEPPYLLSIVLVVMLNYVSTLSPYYRGAPFSIDWKNVLGHVAYLNVFTGGNWLSPVYWSLAIEFQYYLIIALAFTWVCSGRWMQRLAFYFLFAASAFVFGKGAFIFTFSAYFLIGIGLFQFVSGIIERGEFVALQAVSLGLICYRFGWELMAISIATVLVILFVRKVPRPLLYLGTISYSLYLIHVPVGERIINISEVLIKNLLLRQIIVVAAVVVCLVSAALYYRIVEKYFKQAAGAIGYKRKAAAVEPIQEPVVL